MKFIVIAFCSMFLFGTGLAPAASAASANFTCDGTYTGVTVKNVRVAPGASCTLIDSVVTGNVHARNPVDVKILDTDVAHNVMVMGATGTVVVGSAGCKYDPHAGNNVMVKKSHNVLICFMDVDNNIRVTGSDGRITVRNSSAGRNIGVDRNLAYVSDGATDHANPGAIRLLNLTAGGHVTTKHNDPSRTIVRRNITTG